MLKEIFEKQLKEEPIRKSSNAPGDFKIRPSVLGSKCLRQVFYSATGVPEDVPFPLTAKKRMKLGEAVHEMLGQAYEAYIIPYVNPDGSQNLKMNAKSAHDHDPEFVISSEELFIKKGKIDAVMIVDGELWLAEYKSINLRGFQGLTGPKTDHLIQAVTYLYVFNKMLADGKFLHIPKLSEFQKAEGITMLYINKDDSEMKEYRITNAESTFEAIVNKIMTIKRYAEEGVLPPCTPEYGRTCSCGWQIKSKNNQIR